MKTTKPIAVSTQSPVTHQPAGLAARFTAVKSARWLLAATLALFAVVVAPQRADAGVGWGSTSSTNWTTGASWVGGAVPGWGNGLDVVFYANATTIYTNNIGSADVTMRQLYFYQTNFSGTPPNLPSALAILPTTQNDIIVNLSDGAGTPHILNFARSVGTQNGQIWMNSGSTNNVIIGAGIGSINISAGAGLNINHLGSGTLTIGSPITQGAAGKTLALTASPGYTGSGTTVLSAANTYSGATTISAGQLVLAAGSSIAASSGVILGTDPSAILQLNTNQTISSLSGGGTSGGTVNLQSYTLTVSGTGSGSYSGLISGTTGGLTKLGTGALTLSGTSANSYSGPTIVGGGTLGVAAVNYPSASALTVSNGAALTLDVTGGATTVATPSVTFGTNTTLTFSYGVLPGGNPFVPAMNNAAATGTTLTANGTNIVINVSGSGFGVGQFTLIKYSGSIGGNGFGAFQLGSLPLGAVATLSNNTANASIDLVISGFSQATWQGYVNGQWDTNTVNWTNVYSGYALAFSNSIAAILDDTASGTTSLTLNGVLQPGKVVVDNSTLNYSLSGAGSLGGTMSLTKNGTAALLIATTNNYTGDTTINAGTAQFGDGTTANGSVTGNIVNNGAVVMANPRAQTYPGVISGTGPLTVSGNATLSGVNTYTGQTTVTNNGTLTLSGNRTNNSGIIRLYSGTMNIQNGNFSMGANGFYLGAGLGFGSDSNATVNQTGGNITYGSSLALLVGNGTLPSGATYTYNLSGGSIAGFSSTTRGVMFGVNPGDGGNLPTAAFNLSGSGFLNMSNSMVALGRSDATTDNWKANFNQTGGRAVIGTLTMGGVGTSGSGNINASLNLTGGTNIVSSFTHLAEAQNNTCTINIGGTADVTLAAFPTTAHGAGSTATLTLNGGILRPYAASTVYMQGLDNAYLTTNGANINVASGNDITVAQAFTDAPSQVGKLVKTGVGILTLTGANAYSGGTTVSNGTLVLGAAHAATGSLTAADGTKLGCLSDAPGVTVNLPGATIGNTTAGAGLLAQFKGNLGNPTAPAGYITNLTLSGPTPVSVLASGLQVGTIPLLQYSTLSGAGSITNGTPPQGVVGTITNDTTTKTISLVVTAIYPVVWSGQSGTNWDINVSTNWSVNGTPTPYLNSGSACLFNDTAVTGTIVITQAVSPTGLVFSNNTVAYSLGASGSGSLAAMNGSTGLSKDGSGSLKVTTVLSGSGGLNMQGSGTLTLTAVNTFTGGTVVSGGTLNLDNTGHGNPQPCLAPQSDLTISNATVNLVGNTYNAIYDNTGGTVTIAAGGTLIANGTTPNQDNLFNLTMAGGTLAAGPGSFGSSQNANFSINGAITVTDNSTISAAIQSGGTLPVDVVSGKTLLVSGTVANKPTGSTDLTKTGLGTLILAGTNTYTGATTVDGTLLVNGMINSSSTVTLNSSATLGGSGTVAGTASFSDGSFATNNVGSPLTLGTLDMAGNATMNVATASPLSAGIYPLINYTSLTSSGLFTNLNIGGAGLAGGATASVVFTNNTVALSVVGGVPTPTNISYTISGSSLILNWPAGQGWQLQSQTNSLSTGLTTNWTTVSGATPPFTNTITPANPAVFYRLKY